MMIVSIVVGLALLCFGRQLFWLFVGGVGFAAGLALATEFLQGQPDWLVLAVAIGAGLIGALLAVLLQRLAISVAGFLAGGYVLLNLATRLGYAEWDWIAFLVGAVLGAILVMVLFDWALIGLSSVTGALLVLDGLRLEASVSLVAFVVLLVVGIVVQSSHRRREAPAPPPPE